MCTFSLSPQVSIGHNSLHLVPNSPLVRAIISKYKSSVYGLHISLNRPLSVNRNAFYDLADTLASYLTSDHWTLKPPMLFLLAKLTLCAMPPLDLRHILRPILVSLMNLGVGHAKRALPQSYIPRSFVLVACIILKPSINVLTYRIITTFLPA